jgi:DNA-binding response OmpR family regulator
LLRELFERAGHQVAEAAEGGCIVGLAQAERPQVIVTSHGDEDTRVREKLGSAANYIQTVLGVGYRLDAGGS